MDLQKLDQLESRISEVLRLVAELKEKNYFLEAKVNDLEQVLSGKAKEMDQIKLEKQQWDQEKELVRNRVETMLMTLDDIRPEERTF